MKKILRRDKMKIYGDLLSILESENENQVVLSRLQLKLNVPYDRLKQYLEHLAELDLIEDEASPKLTEKGREFIREYEKILTFMKRIGLEYK